MSAKSIRVSCLARVEGEGGLHVKVRGGQVADVKLNIFEPPRYFEALLRGRDFSEAPDITARICGICPVAYQMSAVHAMERAFDIAVPPPIRALRRLLYCGEWIESHVLHIYLLHAPDYLGCQDALQVARTHPDVVRRALRLKKIGNQIVSLVGGREIHPINVRVGGFHRAPTPGELQTLVEPLQWAADAAAETVRFTASLPMPDLEVDYEFVTLRHPDEYPMNEGRIISNRGLHISVTEYESHFAEEHVPHSTALHSTVRKRGTYLVGPLARYALNFDRLAPRAQEEARRAGLGEVCRNPFQSIVVRAVETLHACEEALRLIREYEPPDAPAVEVHPCAGTGHAATEAPRGILYHRYRVDQRGSILSALIVPPTAQNQKQIEMDVREVVERNLGLPEPDLAWLCEQAVRCYDPCISCSTHFLRLHVDRQP